MSGPSTCRGPPAPRRVIAEHRTGQAYKKRSTTMDEIHMDKTEGLTHPSDDPYIRGLLAPGGELEWLWDATITLTIDGRVLFVDSGKDGRFSRRTLLVDPEDTGALFAVMFCPWGERRPAAGGYPIWEPALDELDDSLADPDFVFDGAGSPPSANDSSEA